MYWRSPLLPRAVVCFATLFRLVQGSCGVCFLSSFVNCWVEARGSCYLRQHWFTLQTRNCQRSTTASPRSLTCIVQQKSSLYSPGFLASTFVACTYTCVWINEQQYGLNLEGGYARQFTTLPAIMNTAYECNSHGSGFAKKLILQLCGELHKMFNMHMYTTAPFQSHFCEGGHFKLTSLCRLSWIHSRYSLSKSKKKVKMGVQKKKNTMCEEKQLLQENW